MALGCGRGQRDICIEIWKALHFSYSTGSVISSGVSWNCYSGKKIHTETRYASLSFIIQVKSTKISNTFLYNSKRRDVIKLGLPVTNLVLFCWFTLNIEPSITQYATRAVTWPLELFAKQDIRKISLCGRAAGRFCPRCLTNNVTASRESFINIVINNYCEAKNMGSLWI